MPPLPANFESLSVDEKEAIEYAGVKIRARNVGNVKFIGLPRSYFGLLVLIVPFRKPL